MSFTSVDPTSEAHACGEARQSPGGRPIEPLDDRLDSIQPGGGICMTIELAWGRLRRLFLRSCFPGYVRRLRRLRRGVARGCPHEVLDPRDIKFYRNQGGYYWRGEDDPFRWRDRIPFARAGLAELVLLAGGCMLLAILALWYWPPAAWAPLLACTLLVWFFRDPPRAVPAEPGLWVAPADGRVVAIERLDHEEYLGGPAIRIDIFLSIFNVHLNRSPVSGTVVGIRYRPGKFLNALRPEASRENEQLELRLEELEWPHRPLIVRQITGAVARRIVCWAAVGARLARGERFGMIKLGSRTELVLPASSNLRVCVQLGDKLHAGSTVMARASLPEPGAHRG